VNTASNLKRERERKRGRQTETEQGCLPKPRHQNTQGETLEIVTLMLTALRIIFVLWERKLGIIIQFAGASMGSSPSHFLAP